MDEEIEKGEHADGEPDPPVDVKQVDEDVADAALEVLIEREGGLQPVGREEVEAGVLVRMRVRVRGAGAGHSARGEVAARAKEE